jgi:hypothetical protein
VAWFGRGLLLAGRTPDNENLSHLGPGCYIWHGHVASLAGSSQNSDSFVLFEPDSLNLHLITSVSRTALFRPRVILLSAERKMSDRLSIPQSDTYLITIRSYASFGRITRIPIFFTDKSSAESGLTVVVLFMRMTSIGIVRAHCAVHTAPSACASR